MTPPIRIGNGIDVHPFVAPATHDGVASGRLVLAGVTIPDAPALEGHSDADVVAHALADALLGALAMGDLGERFGVDDPELAGADSMQLLRLVVDDVRARHWRVANVDVTVIAQIPRLAPYRDLMRSNLAQVLGVDVDAVSVKLTTTDELGAVGRREGIAAIASCLVADQRG